MGVLLRKAPPLRFSHHPLYPPWHPSSFRRTLAVPTGSRGSLNLASRRCAWKRNLAVFCSITASFYETSSAYGGWDEPGPCDDAGDSLANFKAFRYLSVVMGISNGKYAVLFCLGFVSALAVSRIRVWRLAVLPFSALVFVSGVLVGIAQGGVAGEVLTMVRRNQDGVKLSHEKIKDFGELLEDFGAKLSHLICCLQRLLDLNPVESGEIKGYLDVLGSVIGASTPLKKIVDEFTVLVGVDSVLEVKSNAKWSKKRREANMLGIDVLQFLTATFQDVILWGYHGKAAKNNGIRKEVIEGLGPKEDPSFQAAAGVKGSTSPNKEKRVVVPRGNLEEDEVNPLKNEESFEGRPIEAESSTRTMSLNSTESSGSTINAECDRMSADSTEDRNASFYLLDDCSDHGLLFNKLDYRAFDGDFHFTSMRESYHKMVLEHRGQKTEIGMQQNQVLKHSDSEMNSVMHDDHISFSSVAETSLKSTKKSELYDTINANGKGEGTSRTIGFRDKAKKLETVLDNQLSIEDKESNKKTSSAERMPMEEEFNHAMKHGLHLLSQAGECLKCKNDEKAAESLLYRSTRILSTAVSMQPENLLVLGQLGNSCLLHGELKLKMSRDLRTLLSRDNRPLTRKGYQSQSGMQNNQLNRENVASMLFDVCEECEELLIEAGRNYKLVLSYDRNDSKALYNWGLALSFRADLIADIGPVLDSTRHFVSSYFCSHYLNYDAFDVYYTAFHNRTCIC